MNSSLGPIARRSSLPLFFVGLVFFLWGPLLLIFLKGIRPRAIEALFNDSEILSALLQSIGLAVVSALLSTLAGAATAFALPKLPALGRRLTMTGLVFPLVLPEIAFALALMVWFVKLRIPFSWGTLIAGHVAFSFSYACLVLKGGVESVDPSLVEASRDCGASGWKVFRHGLWPQIAPSVWASLVTGFALSLDDFLVSFFNKGLDQNLLPIRIYSMMRLKIGPELYALSLLLFCLSLAGVLGTQLWLYRKQSSRNPLPSSS